MTAEAPVAAVVDGICAQPQLTPEALYRLRFVARNSAVEGAALQNRLAQTEGEALSPEEKGLRKAAYYYILQSPAQARGELVRLSGPVVELIKAGLAIESDRCQFAVDILRQVTSQIQHPLIDDNGDKIGHNLNESGCDPETPGEDGYLAANTFL